MFRRKHGGADQLAGAQRQPQHARRRRRRVRLRVRQVAQGGLAEVAVVVVAPRQQHAAVLALVRVQQRLVPLQPCSMLGPPVKLNCGTPGFCATMGLEPSPSSTANPGKYVGLPNHVTSLRLNVSAMTLMAAAKHVMVPYAVFRTLARHSRTAHQVQQHNVAAARLIAEDSNLFLRQQHL